MGNIENMAMTLGQKGGGGIILNVRLTIESFPNRHFVSVIEDQNEREK